MKIKNNDLQSREGSVSSSISHRQKLLAAIRNGDEAAFAEYYYGFVDSLVGFLKRLLGNEEEAKEITQEVFIKLWENKGSIDPDRKLDSFVYTTAKNMALNIIKKRQVHSKYVSERASASNDAYLSADASIISNETQILIDIVVDRMPTQRRKVFELSRKDGLSYEEIAKLMDVSTETVKSHIKLALKDIRDVIAVFITILLLG